MVPTSVHDIRNLGMLGQAGAGKTQLLETLLATSGAITSVGSVEKGDTVSDFDPLEKQMGHSINATVTHMEWAGHWLNVIDTPGTPDFFGRALAVLPAVETAMVVINARWGRANRVNGAISPAWFMPISNTPNLLRAGIRARLSGTPTWLL